MTNLLTVEKIQEIFSCGRRQAYELVNSEGFPSLRIGRKILVPEVNLQTGLKNMLGKPIMYDF